MTRGKERAPVRTLVAVVEGHPFRSSGGGHHSDSMLECIGRIGWARLHPVAEGGFFTEDVNPRVKAVWYLRSGQPALFWDGREKLVEFQPGLFG